MEIGVLICDIGKCMVTAAAEHHAPQKIIPLLFMRLGKAAHSYLYLIE